MERFKKIYTVAHVMAEVSNLTGLSGRERLEPRRILASAIAIFHEPHVPSHQAVPGRHMNLCRGARDEVHSAYR
jgi:hypothetical protein